MTLDEAIKHAEEVAEENEKFCYKKGGEGGYFNEDTDWNNTKCAEEHRQLAEWLKDYKRLLEQEPSEDCISRQAALGCCRNEWEEEVEMRLKSLPSVTPQQKYEDVAKAFQLGMAFGFGEKHDEMDRVIDEIKKTITPQAKTGRWIKYGIPRCGEQHYKCTLCEYYINFGQWGELYTKEFKYCPNCGAKMENN